MPQTSLQTLRILVTGAGAPGIRGTLRALKPLSEEFKLKTIAIDANPRSIGKQWVDSFYSVPKADDPNYFDCLEKVIKTEQVDLIIPQTTLEIAFLSKKKALLESHGTQVMVSSPEAIEIANNKGSLLEVFKSLNLPYPEYAICSTRADFLHAIKSLGYPDYPVAIKPTVSNGMRGFRVLTEKHWNLERFLSEKPSGTEINLNDLLKILDSGTHWPELLVTEYLPGHEYSVDVFMGQKCQFAIPRLRENIRSGISFSNRLEHHQDMEEWSLQVAEHIGLRYAVGFQYKLDRFGTPKVLESNPRIQGTMVASMYSGANIIAMAVKELLGFPPEQPKINLQNIHFQRFWGGVGIMEEYTDEI